MIVQSIRKNVLTLITPVIEAGRSRQDRRRRACLSSAHGTQSCPTPYWGKYVAHDNNRDGMGQYLKLTQNVRGVANDVAPHDHARPA